MLRNFVNARRKFRAGVRSTLPFERNVIFPTFWIARDVISNSRQSTDIYRRYLTWFRFVVHHVVRRGVICDHNSPLNVALDACAEPCLFFFLFPPPCVPPVSRRPRSRISFLSPRTVTIYEHIFRVSHGKLARNRSSNERRRPNSVPRFNLRFCAIIESTRTACFYFQKFEAPCRL